VPLENFSVTIDPYQLNYVAYLLEGPADVEDVVDSIDLQSIDGQPTQPVLLVSNDSGGFYVPSEGIMTLQQMVPGEGYYVWLKFGMDSVTLDYSMVSQTRAIGGSALAQKWAGYRENSKPTHYSVYETGAAFPVIINQIIKDIEIGDEIAVYDGDVVVGAVKVIDFDGPIVMSVWEGFSVGSSSIPGYSKGSEMSFKLWDASEGRELYLDVDLNSMVFGEEPLVKGAILDSFLFVK